MRRAGALEPLRLRGSWFGAGLHFPKSFKKFDALARKKKFPEISRARRQGPGKFPEASQCGCGCGRAMLGVGYQTVSQSHVCGLDLLNAQIVPNKNIFFDSVHRYPMKRLFLGNFRHIFGHRNDMFRAWFMMIKEILRNFTPARKEIWKKSIKEIYVPSTRNVRLGQRVHQQRDHKRNAAALTLSNI